MKHALLPLPPCPWKSIWGSKGKFIQHTPGWMAAFVSILLNIFSISAVWKPTFIQQQIYTSLVMTQTTSKSIWRALHGASFSPMPSETSRGALQLMGRQLGFMLSWHEQLDPGNYCQLQHSRNWDAPRLSVCVFVTRLVAISGTGNIQRVVEKCGLVSTSGSAVGNTTVTSVTLPSYGWPKCP